MSIVADTSVLVDHLRGNEGAAEALEHVRSSEEPLLASTLTKVEILAGVRPGEEPVVRRLFAELEWVPVDDEVAERAGELASSFLRTHPGVEVVDYVIAATAEIREASLWTRNLKHFPMFPQLEAPYG